MISEHKKEYMRKWRAANRAHIAEWQKKYNDEHREEKAAYSRDYYHSHHERSLERMRKYKSKNKDSMRRLSKEYLTRTNRAQPKVMAAIASGKLTKKPCEKCGAEAEAHHDDYNYPLKVRWLCRKHHAEWHRFNKPIYYGEGK